MIVVAGGTGRLGTTLVELLSEHGQKVGVLARNAPGPGERAGKVEVIACDVRDGDAVARAVEGADTIVSAITGFGMARDVSPRSVDWHGNVNLIRASVNAGVDRFVLVSVHQAAPDHPMELFRMKFRAEEELRSSRLGWTVIRPTAYMETWVELLGAPLQREGHTRVFGRGENPINFVSVRDTARVVELAATGPAMPGVSVDLGGPENVTMNGVIERFTAITGASGKVSHVPLPMMRAMSQVMKPFNQALASLIGAGVIMDTRDMSFDPVSMDAHIGSIATTTMDDVIRKDYGTGQA